MKRTNAFTLIELLVVVAIIALLIAILLPSMNRAISAAKTAVCASQQHQIELTMKSYAVSNMGKFFDHRNWGSWITPGTIDQPIDPEHGNAYWGVAYAEAAGREGVKQLFNCPEANDSDPKLADGLFSAGHIWVTYGMNGLYQYFIDINLPGSDARPPLFTGKGGHKDPARPLSDRQHPGTTPLFQDAYEAVLDGNGDMPWSFGQWTTQQNREYFRHNGDRDSSFMFVDGHVGIYSIDYDWDIRFYLGGSY